MKKILLSFIIFAMLICFASCKKEENIETMYKDAKIINLSNDVATINNVKINEYDYTWHVDPSEVHEDVKDAPAEYYTGEKPADDVKIYIDHELYYYPFLDTSKYQLVNYDGEKEWAYYYEDGINNEYIFATLPYFYNSKEPINTMMFTSDEALNNKVLHIKEAGTYILEGKWNGQINVDLGEESFSDENSKVTLMLNNIDINCTVAPAIIFNSAYEFDNLWEEREETINEIDTSNAGVNIIVADDSVNNVSGKNIYRMLKTKYKDEESKDEIKVQKKIRKMDAPFYSCVSMNINGEEKGNGILNISSSFEGLDSELHLTIKGSIININSEDDGMNVNEDDVSIVSFLGGTVTINAANGNEGDGIDSNGFVVIDGSTLNINNIRFPDNAVDSDDGILYRSGTININNELQELEFGNYKEISSNSMEKEFQFNFDFENLDIETIKEKILALPDDATIKDVLEIFGMNNIPFMGGGQPDFDKPENEAPKEKPEGELPKDFPNDDRPPMDDMKEKLNDDFDISKLKDFISNINSDTTIQEIMNYLGSKFKGPNNK